jgi:hypothetical protein
MLLGTLYYEKTQEVSMTTLRSVPVLKALMVVLTVVGAGGTGPSRAADPAREVRAALSLPGTDMQAMTDAQSVKLAARAARLLERNPAARATFAGLLESVRTMRRTGAARALRCYPGSRTLHDVCCEMGRLMLRLQRLEQEGRRAEVAAVLSRVHAARKSGVPETCVQEMVREALSRGELCPGAAEERRLLEARLDELVRQLVKAGQVAGQANRGGAV